MLEEGKDIPPNFAVVGARCLRGVARLRGEEGADDRGVRRTGAGDVRIRRGVDRRRHGRVGAVRHLHPRRVPVRRAAPRRHRRTVAPGPPAGPRRPGRSGPTGRRGRVGPVDRRARVGDDHRAGRPGGRSRHRRGTGSLDRTRRRRPGRPRSLVPRRGRRRASGPGHDVLPRPSPAPADDVGPLRQVAAGGERAPTAPRGGRRTAGDDVAGGRSVDQLRPGPPDRGVDPSVAGAALGPSAAHRLLDRLRAVAPLAGSVRAAHVGPSGDAAGHHRCSTVAARRRRRRHPHPSGAPGLGRPRTRAADRHPPRVVAVRGRHRPPGRDRRRAHRDLPGGGADARRGRGPDLRDRRPPWPPLGHRRRAVRPPAAGERRGRRRRSGAGGRHLRDRRVAQLLGRSRPRAPVRDPGGPLDRPHLERHAGAARGQHHVRRTSTTAACTTRSATGW